MLRLLTGLMIILIALPEHNIAHKGHREDGRCTRTSNSRVHAMYRPGYITLDGNADDWRSVEGFEFSLLPALDPDEEHAYKGGKMTVKATHDGINLFFLLQVDGDYVYTKGENRKCPSVALMFPAAENATYYNMGGCQETKTTCNRNTCRGHEVDIMHFSIGNAVPGHLYGGNQVDSGNGADRFGYLVDVYAWNPHCRFLDGIGPSGNNTGAENNWKGAWWHDGLNAHSSFLEEDSPFGVSGEKGTYYFEFSRPLRTMDHFRQDAQFIIGQPSSFAAAFWYPSEGNSWRGSQHYSISCDWVPLLISSPLVHSRTTWKFSSGFTMIFSVVSLCLSVLALYLGSKAKVAPFTPVSSF